MSDKASNCGNAVKCQVCDKVFDKRSSKENNESSLKYHMSDKHSEEPEVHTSTDDLDSFTKSNIELMKRRSQRFGIISCPVLRKVQQSEAKRAKTTNNLSRKTSHPRQKIDPSKSSTKEGLKTSCSGLKGVDIDHIKTILDEVIPKGMGGVKFSDISGQDKAKEALREMVILPSLRPDLFTGLRTPARGLLLFGPPGNGKTLLARALAGESSCNLINISSATLTSKWLGEGEKLVKALFSVARAIQPTIIFIDEMDALLAERKAGEHEALRRIKTEFLLQFDGMMTSDIDRTVVVAATNRPQELDEAALRRFMKRVYVRMPDPDARFALVSTLLGKNANSIDIYDLDEIVTFTEGYTCSDITNLARDAAMAPIREATTEELAEMLASSMRRITLRDFVASSKRVRGSLTEQVITGYKNWNTSFADIS